MTTLRQLRTLVLGVVTLFLALGLPVPATAATLNFNNFNFSLDGTELLLVDNAGVPLTRGFVALYQFGNPGDAPTDHRSLQSNGDTGLLDLVEIGPANSPGGIGVMVTPLSAFNDNGEIQDLPLYIVVGDGADAASSRILGMLNTGISFLAADIPSFQSVFYSASASHLEIGRPGQQLVSAPGVGEWNARTLVLVPEPSATILQLLSALVVLRRRKR